MRWEKEATLVITENSTGSLKAVGGAYGAAGIGGKPEQQVTKVQIITVGQERL